MRRRALYVDSSALVKLVRTEAETAALATLLAGRDLAASSLARVEVVRAVRRAGSGELEMRRAEEVLATLFLVPLDDEILERASLLDPASLRSLDALHLATALMLAADLDAFVAYDTSLVAAARAAGLTVVAPA